MKQYFVIWSFVDRDGVTRKGGDVVELDDEYAAILLSKRLIKNKVVEMKPELENKAADVPSNKAEVKPDPVVAEPEPQSKPEPETKAAEPEKKTTKK